MTTCFVLRVSRANIPCTHAHARTQTHKAISPNIVHTFSKHSHYASQSTCSCLCVWHQGPKHTDFRAHICTRTSRSDVYVISNKHKHAHAGMRARRHLSTRACILHTTHTLTYTYTHAQTHVLTQPRPYTHNFCLFSAVTL